MNGLFRPPPFPNVFCGLCPRWIREINPDDWGKRSIYLKTKNNSKEQSPDSDLSSGTGGTSEFSTKDRGRVERMMNGCSEPSGLTAHHHGQSKVRLLLLLSANSTYLADVLTGQRSEHYRSKTSGPRCACDLLGVSQSRWVACTLKSFTR